ncbi:hypothetical protein ADL22_32370 [Streptomyces sp. NRRL F-4489]|uniref:hypothetical protein n=1 Tax=Streptomyces sp. NRRL F-4489 TaxID=1609095 RepID=UPI0007494C87|nr:hypothetical protein [Streptomyces sp. NRRL F-4489]KUL33689.1 hypothetical protein ADL22_32370 [Streptomyces sp. NRRL F-4489]
MTDSEAEGRAAGLEFPCGRQAVADALQEFLTATSDTGGTFYVTGAAGTGRSTVLTWLFLRSQAEGEGEESGAGTDSARPVFHAALGARGRGADDLATALGQQLGYETATAGELLSVLAADARPVCVALGELDEAGPVPNDRHTRHLIETLLAPMAKLPTVRLVTEGAPEWAPFFEGCEIVDLDQPRWTGRAAFDGYVAALCGIGLGGEGGLDDRGEQPLPLPADEISRAAYPNFLLAQLLVLERLLADPAEPGRAQPADPHPATTHDTVARLLHTLSADVPLAADALYALALAGPAGIDRRLWRLATAAVAGRQVRSGEFGAALDASRALLAPHRPDPAGDGDGDDETPYRLRHPAIGTALLALRPPEAERAGRTAVIHSLAGRVPVDPAAEGAPHPLWSQAPPGLLSALIKQAAAVPGALGPLLDYPGVLLHADLDGLRAAAAASADASAVALRPVLDLLHPPSAHQAARLQVAAFQHGLTRLASAVESAQGGALPFRALRLVPQQGGPRADEGSEATGEDASRDAVVLTETGTLEAGQGAGAGQGTGAGAGEQALRWTLHGTPFTAARTTQLDTVPVVLLADREGLLQVRSHGDGRLLRPTVRTDEVAEHVCLLTATPDPLSACAAADRLWLARLHDGSTLAELRFGSDITALTTTAEGQLDVDFGGSRIRLAFAPEHLYTSAGAAPSGRTADH